MRARRYILRRLLQAVPVLFFVSVIVFVVLHLSPGDPAVQMYGAQPRVTRDMIEAARREMGLDKPWDEQYFFWLANLLRGDMGESYVNHLPVRTVIGQKLPASLESEIGAAKLTVDNDDAHVLGREAHSAVALVHSPAIFGASQWTQSFFVGRPGQKWSGLVHQARQEHPPGVQHAGMRSEELPVPVTLHLSSSQPCPA